MEEGAVIKHDIKKAPKTGEWGIEFPNVDKKKCLGCGTCASFCPEAAIELSAQEKKTVQIDYAFCKGCGVCASVCPSKAISMKKKS
jgi:pyruvate ferredoxin oxidoreductase delta subunit